VLCCCLQGEQLAAGALAQEGSNVILASSGGMLAHFPVNSVRQAGRAAGCIKVSRSCRMCFGTLPCGSGILIEVWRHDLVRVDT
jgi:hypothetical protein